MSAVSTPSPLSLVGGRKVETRTLTTNEILNKKLILAETSVIASSVTVNSPNGPIQIIGQDFIVTGNEVSWNGYGLETILEAGDKLIIVYS